MKNIIWTAIIISGLWWYFGRTTTVVYRSAPEHTQVVRMSMNDALTGESRVIWERNPTSK